MKRAALLLAALLLTPIAAGCSRNAPDASRVDVAFNPPLEQPLRYHYRKVRQDGSGTDTRESNFSVVFHRESAGLVMAVTSLRPDGSLWPASAGSAPVTERRFRIARDGALLSMENEQAYWAALERDIQHRLARPGQTEAELRSLRGWRQGVHDSQSLPPRERLADIAGDAGTITEFAARSYARMPVEAPVGKQTVVGPVEFMQRTAVARFSVDRLTLVQTSTMPPERMQAFVARLERRYNDRLRSIGSRLVSLAWRSTVELDRRSGLLRRRDEVNETVSRDGDRTLRLVVTSRLEQVPRSQPARPSSR